VPPFYQKLARHSFADDNGGASSITVTKREGAALENGNLENVESS